MARWLFFFTAFFYGYAMACSSPIISAFGESVSRSPERVRALPGVDCLTTVQLAGYLPVAENGDPRLFYWFVESTQSLPDTPIVLWLSGEPGASSLSGLFMEHGPYSVTKSGALKTRRYAWNQRAHYWVIDQPVGVGLSVAGEGSYRNESQAMNQLHVAVQSFFTRYPELRTRPLFLAGQSYAGKYIPQLAVRLLAEEKANKQVNLKGVLIGNGWVNPIVQQSANASFAYAHGLIDLKTSQKIERLYQYCADEIDKKTPSSRRANQVCMRMQHVLKQESGLAATSNIHTGKETNATAMVYYLNRVEVREALHVSPKAGRFRLVDPVAADVLEEGKQDSIADLYPVLLRNKVHVVIYNGLYDGTEFNFMGTDRWIAALEWPGKKAFAETETCIWKVGSRVAGYAKAASGLTQVKIRYAGHAASGDQPRVLLDLLHRVVSEKSFCQ